MDREAANATVVQAPLARGSRTAWSRAKVVLVMILALGSVACGDDWKASDYSDDALRARSDEQRREEAKRREAAVKEFERRAPEAIERGRVAAEQLVKRIENPDLYRLLDRWGTIVVEFEKGALSQEVKPPAAKALSRADLKSQFRSRVSSGEYWILVVLSPEARSAAEDVVQLVDGAMWTGEQEVGGRRADLLFVPKKPEHLPRVAAILGGGDADGQLQARSLLEGHDVVWMATVGSKLSGDTVSQYSRSLAELFGLL